MEVIPPHHPHQVYHSTEPLESCGYSDLQQLPEFSADLIKNNEESVDFDIVLLDKVHNKKVLNEVGVDDGWSSESSEDNNSSDRCCFMGGHEALACPPDDARADNLNFDRGVPTPFSAGGDEYFTDERIAGRMDTNSERQPAFSDCPANAYNETENRYEDRTGGCEGSSRLRKEMERRHNVYHHPRGDISFDQFSRLLNTYAMAGQRSPPSDAEEAARALARKRDYVNIEVADRFAQPVAQDCFPARRSSTSALEQKRRYPDYLKSSFYCNNLLSKEDSYSPVTRTNAQQAAGMTCDSSSFLNCAANLPNNNASYVLMEDAVDISIQHGEFPVSVSPDSIGMMDGIKVQCEQGISDFELTEVVVDSCSDIVCNINNRNSEKSFVDVNSSSCVRALNHEQRLEQKEHLSVQAPLRKYCSNTNFNSRANQKILEGSTKRIIERRGFPTHKSQPQISLKNDIPKKENKSMNISFCEAKNNLIKIPPVPEYFTSTPIPSADSDTESTSPTRISSQTQPSTGKAGFFSRLSFKSKSKSKPPVKFDLEMKQYDSDTYSSSPPSPLGTFFPSDMVNQPYIVNSTDLAKSKSFKKSISLRMTDDKSGIFSVSDLIEHQHKQISKSNSMSILRVDGSADNLLRRVDERGSGIINPSILCTTSSSSPSSASGDSLYLQMNSFAMTDMSGGTTKALHPFTSTSMLPSVQEHSIINPHNSMRDTSALNNIFRDFSAVFRPSAEINSVQNGSYWKETSALHREMSTATVQMPTPTHQRANTSLLARQAMSNKISSLPFTNTTTRSAAVSPAATISEASTVGASSGINSPAVSDRIHNVPLPSRQQLLRYLFRSNSLAFSSHPLLPLLRQLVWTEYTLQKTPAAASGISHPASLTELLLSFSQRCPESAEIIAAVLPTRVSVTASLSASSREASTDFPRHHHQLCSTDQVMMEAVTSTHFSITDMLAELNTQSQDPVLRPDAEVLRGIRSTKTLPGGVNCTVPSLTCGIYKNLEHASVV